MIENEDKQKEEKHYTVVIEHLGLVIAKVVIWILLAGGVLFYFWWKYTEKLGIASPEAYEYAQIARNNARGEWFRTDVIRPVGLWLEPDVRNHPDLFHPPAYSVVLAGLMKIGRAQDRTILWGSGLFYFLTIPVLYFATRSMFNRRIARIGVFFYIIMPAIGIASVSGTPGTFAAFLVTAAFGLLWAVRPRRYIVTVAAGLALAACALTATRYVFLLLPAVGYLVLTLRRHAWVHVPILVLVTTVGVLPWARRNERLTGSPWAPMEWTSSYQLSEESKERAVTEMRPTLASSHAIEHAFAPEALGITLSDKEGVRSLARNLRLALSDLVRYGAQSVLVILCLAGVLVRSKNRHTEWLRIALYVAIVIELIYGAVTRPDSFLLLPYVPFMVVLGTFALIELIDRLGYTRPISRFALIAVAIVVATAQSIVTTNPAEAFTEADRDRYGTCRVLDELIRENLEPEAVVVSNVPWHTAWYLDRPSIWLPPCYEDLMRLRMQTDERITFAFLAGYALETEAPSYHIWKQGLSEGRMPDSFGLMPFYSTVLMRTDVYSSFISPEQRERLRRGPRGTTDETEPSTPDDTAGSATRPTGQDNS